MSSTESDFESKIQLCLVILKKLNEHSGKEEIYFCSPTEVKKNNNLLGLDLQQFDELKTCEQEVFAILKPPGLKVSKTTDMPFITKIRSEKNHRKYVISPVGKKFLQKQKSEQEKELRDRFQCLEQEKKGLESFKTSLDKCIEAICKWISENPASWDAKIFKNDQQRCLAEYYCANAPLSLKDICKKLELKPRKWILNLSQSLLKANSLTDLKYIYGAPDIIVEDDQLTTIFREALKKLIDNKKIDLEEWKKPFVFSGQEVSSQENDSDLNIDDEDDDDDEEDDNEDENRRDSRDYKKQMILYGPPGTGKTYSTVFHAVAIIEGKTLDEIKAEDDKEVFKCYQGYETAGKIAFITFHQSYGYEEFIEGIRPVLPNQSAEQSSGDIKYELRDGVFKEFCNKAKDDPEQKYVFIIDEINRGNISKIFGELITLIESSKRLGASEERKAKLPYSGEDFGVPDNVYLIGTMNTADRSIALLDTALRRRFHFIEMLPDYSVLKDITIEGINIRALLEKMNERIEVLHDRDHQIGHSYFLPLRKNASMSALAEIFQDQIIPLLQEYFYNDYEKIRLVLGDNQKANEENRFIQKKDKSAMLFGEKKDEEFSDRYTINKDAFSDPQSYVYLQ